MSQKSRKFYIKKEITGLKDLVLNKLLEGDKNISELSRFLKYSYKSTFNAVKFLEYNKFIKINKIKTKNGMESYCSIKL